MHRFLYLVVVAALAGALAAGCLMDRNLATPGPDGEASPGSVCGNGVKEAGEFCDDGNRVDGDGCSTTCAFEGTCLVTLGGGSPVAVSVTSIAPDGTLGTPRTIEVEGHHLESDGAGPVLDQLVTACGPHVYVGAVTSETIARLDLDPQGGLVSGGIWYQPNLLSLRCDPATETLQVLSYHQSTLALQLVEYTLDATGDLPSGVTLTLDLPDQPPEFEGTSGFSWTVPMSKVSLLGHPVTGDLWILAGYESLNWVFFRATTAWRLARDPSGTLDVREGPTQIHDEPLHRFWLTDDGTRLLLGGIAGGRFGWFDLPGSGGLPVAATLIDSIESPETLSWGNVFGLAVSSGDEPFSFAYAEDFSQESGMLARGRCGADRLEHLDEIPIPGLRSRLLRVPGTDLVVTFGVDGQLATVDTGDASLVVVDTVTIPGVEYGGSGVVVPCMP